MIIFVTDIVVFVCCLRMINSKRFGGGIWLRFLRKNWSFVKCHLRRVRVVNQTWARRVAEDNYCGMKRTATKDNMAESFRVTQRLAVWCCANLNSLSPKRWYWPTRLHGAITPNTQLPYWNSQTLQRTQDEMGRVFSMNGMEEECTVGCMEGSVGDL